MTTESGISRVTKRFVVSVLSSGLIYWSLKVHRDWVWSYFESIMRVDCKAMPDVANVATVSINALTTAFIAGSSSIAFIVAFFITGNVAALRGMFQWGSVAQTVGQVTSEAVNVRETSRGEVDEKIVQEFAKKYAKEPSYRPMDTLPDRDVEEFR